MNVVNKLKAVLCAAVILTSSASSFAEEMTAETLLKTMSSATNELNFELSYILIRKNSIEPILYRQANLNEQRLAQLMYLSGPVREVIRRGNEISYIEPGAEPFSIQSDKMVAPLMPLLFSDIDNLSESYDFVLMGRAREAGVITQVVRIVPKDGKRYSYVLWIDEQMHLPLRADLVDRDGEVLEQYRTVAHSVSDKLVSLMSGLNDIELPAVLSVPKHETQNSQWEVTKVPRGFDSQPYNRYLMANTEKMVESQIFSDGLFQFSVYVADIDNLTLKGQLVRQGRRTLHSIHVGDKEITVVGDLPPETAHEIALSVKFKINGDNPK
jgi:sigma-E factor negative regulatory protein RseB